MKNKRFLFEYILAIFMIVLLSSITYAAQSTVGSRTGDIKPAHSPNIAIKPLQQPLSIKPGMAPSFCTILNQAIDEANTLAFTDLQKTVMLEQGKLFLWFPGVSELKKCIYSCEPPSTVQYCCSQQQVFTVQDQQTAGCLNNETVQQCMDKLVRQCIKTVVTKKNIKPLLRKSQQKADELATESKQLSDKLNQVINMLP